MSDRVLVPGSSVAPVAARLANHRRVVGIICALPAFALVLSADELDRLAKDNASALVWVGRGAWLVLLVAGFVAAALSLFRSTQLDRAVSWATAHPHAEWLLEGARVGPVMPDEVARRRLTFRVGPSQRRLLWERASSAPKPEAATAEPAKSAEPAGKPPFRVQGVHVAAFATNLANKVRSLALVCGAVGFAVALFFVNKLIRMDGVTGEKLGYDGSLPIAIMIGTSVMAYRFFQRSRLLQTIAEAAQREPIAVWGVKDTWLYPLDPKLDRNKLAVTLDAKEHTLIYQKPRAPITQPPEPLP